MKQPTKQTVNKDTDWTENETGPEFGFQTVCEVQISLTKDTI